MGDPQSSQLVSILSVIVHEFGEFTHFRMLCMQIDQHIIFHIQLYQPQIDRIGLLTQGLPHQNSCTLLLSMGTPH